MIPYVRSNIYRGGSSPFRCHLHVFIYTFACIASRVGDFRDITMLYVYAFTWNCVHANMYNIYSAQSQVIRGLYVHIVVLYSQPTRST